MDECENLPKNMCDSCIIQLNVAYNLKKNAIQSDIKLRQYMIEFGMNVTSYTACSINTVSVIRPPALLMPTSTTSESVTITTAKSTTVGPPAPPPTVQIQTQPSSQLKTLRPFPVMPVIIKEEPVDYEIMSDITVETNTEAFEEMRNRRCQTNGIHSTTSTSTCTSSSSNKSATPLPVHSMVSVNTKSILLTAQESTDSEFISAYMLSPPSNSNQTTTTTTKASIKPVNKQKSPKTVSVTVSKSKTPSPRSKTKSRTNKNSPKPTPKPTPKTNETKKSAGNRRGELHKLFDDSSLHNKIMNQTPTRQTRQQIKELKSYNGDRVQEQRSRSRTSTPKMDYKSFFTLRVTTPTINGTSSLKRRQSVDQKKKNLNVKTPKKSKYPTENRTSRNTVSHKRTRI